MSDSKKNHSNKFNSSVEREIFEGLQRPSLGYEVIREPEAIRGGADDTGGGFVYWPDFLVRDAAGHYLVIEVKSSFAMTLPNLVKFSEVDRVIRLRPKWRFLLVLVEGRSNALFARRDEFLGLHVHFFHGIPELREVIDREFSEMMSDD